MLTNQLKFNNKRMLLTIKMSPEKVKIWLKNFRWLSMNFLKLKEFYLSINQCNNLTKLKALQGRLSKLMLF